MGWWEYRPYVSVASRRAKAAKEVAKLAKKGRKISPVRIVGRAIATTFWGKAWCQNLESYSDYSNRLPRGRAYARNGSVVDLQIEPGQIHALVSGSELYKIEIRIQTLEKGLWRGIKSECAGKIGSLIELLQGRLSVGVMGIITRRPGGMFPSPKEISLKCSCPDWAEMCKHVAAVLYGVGARLDHEPELLFTLRQADHMDLIAGAGDVGGILKPAAGQRTIAHSDLSEVFGIELEGESLSQATTPPPVQPATGGAAPGSSTRKTRSASTKAVSPARSKPLSQAAKRRKGAKSKPARKRGPQAPSSTR